MAFSMPSRTQLMGLLCFAVFAYFVWKSNAVKDIVGEVTG